MSALARRAAALIGVTALTLSMAACGDDGDGKGGEGGGKGKGARPPAPVNGAPTSGLLFALSQVKADDRTRRSFTYSHQERLRALAGGPLEKSRLSALPIGLGDLGRYPAATIAGPTGIDPAKAGHAWQAGVPPTVAGHLTGPFDADAIGGRLGGLGHKRTGDTWVRRPDGSFDIEDPLTKQGILPTHPLNAIRVDSGRGLTYARLPATLDLVTKDAGGRALDADPAFAAVARCLGTPLAAQLSQRQGSAELVGTAVGGVSQNDLEEVMCVRVAGDANTAATKLRTELGSGRSATGRPWSQIMPGAKAETAGDGVVRLAFRLGADQRPGILFAGFVRSDLPRWA